MADERSDTPILTIFQFLSVFFTLYITCLNKTVDYFIDRTTQDIYRLRKKFWQRIGILKKIRYCLLLKHWLLFYNWVVPKLAAYPWSVIKPLSSMHFVTKIVSS